MRIGSDGGFGRYSRVQYYAYLSFREGRNGKRCKRVSVALPTGRVVSIVYERGTLNSQSN